MEPVTPENVDRLISLRHDFAISAPAPISFVSSSGGQS